MDTQIISIDSKEFNHILDLTLTFSINPIEDIYTKFISLTLDAIPIESHILSLHDYLTNNSSNLLKSTDYVQLTSPILSFHDGFFIYHSQLPNDDLINSILTSVAFPKSLYGSLSEYLYKMINVLNLLSVNINF